MSSELNDVSCQRHFLACDVEVVTAPAPGGSSHRTEAVTAGLLGHPSAAHLTGGAGCFHFTLTDFAE